MNEPTQAKRRHRLFVLPGRTGTPILTRYQEQGKGAVILVMKLSIFPIGEIGVGEIAIGKIELEK